MGAVTTMQALLSFAVILACMQFLLQRTTLAPHVILAPKDNFDTQPLGNCNMVAHVQEAHQNTKSSEKN